MTFMMMKTAGGLVRKGLMAGVEARDGARGRGADEEPRKPEAEAKIMEPEGSV